MQPAGTLLHFVKMQRLSRKYLRGNGQAYLTLGTSPQSAQRRQVMHGNLLGSGRLGFPARI